MSPLRRYRLDKNICQKEFAHKLGISQGNLSKLETREAKPNFYTMQNIYKYYPDLFKMIIKIGEKK